MYKYIFAIDPSGSFREGKGTTGWVLMDRRLARDMTGSGDLLAVDGLLAQGAQLGRNPFDRSVWQAA